MMKLFRRYLCLMFSFVCMSAIGQEMKVKDFAVAANDLTASVYARKDLNERKCALVKVGLALEGAKFEGGVMGDVEFKTGEYWVYMPQGNRVLLIKHNNYLPLMVTFEDYGIEKLVSSTTYRLNILLPEAATSNQKQTLIINYKPSNAIVLVDNNIVNGTNGKAKVELPVKVHEYVVTAEGYDPEQGTVKLKETSPTTINVELVKLTNSQNTVSQSSTNPSKTAHAGDKKIKSLPKIPAEYSTPLYKNIDKTLLLSASQGDSQSQYKVGEAFYFGKNGTEVNFDEGVKWFRMSAEQGDADGMNDYGMMFMLGHGVKQDYKQAYKWLRKAADKGQDNALANLGQMYHNGWEVKQDHNAAFELYRQSAEKGNSYGQYNLGLMYFAGTGVAQSDSDALKWLIKSADQNYLAAIFLLGNMYENGIIVSKNLPEAIKWYKKGAALGDKIAQDALTRLGE